MMQSGCRLNFPEYDIVKRSLGHEVSHGKSKIISTEYEGFESESQSLTRLTLSAA